LRDHQLGDLLVMAQFLARQSRQFISQYQVLGVGKHQRQRG
jgi:hypothetical protein